MMNVHLTAGPALSLVGIAAVTEDVSGRAAAHLARALQARGGELPGRMSKGLYAVCEFPDDYQPGQRFTLFVGVVVEEEASSDIGIQSSEAEQGNIKDARAARAALEGDAPSTSALRTATGSQQDADPPGDVACGPRETPLPEGLVRRQLPPHQYAVLADAGPLRSIGDRVDELLRFWLPYSDYVPAAPFHLFRLGGSWEQTSTEIELCIPVFWRKEAQSDAPRTVPSLNYDGGFIHVLWDYHEAAAAWYSRHFLWRSGETHDSGSERLTRHAFGTWIKSVRSEQGQPPHPELVERGVDGHVRWCWNTKDLVAAHHYFRTEGVRVSTIYSGPGGRDYFDLWATYEGTRLTVCGWPELERDEGARLYPGWVRIGVTDLEASREWYSTYVGMAVREEYPEQGWALMALGVEHHPGASLWWLETLPQGVYTGRVNGPASPCLVLHDKAAFQRYRQFLQDSGIVVSEVFGRLGGFARFHFFDPDGNRVSIQSY